MGKKNKKYQLPKNRIIFPIILYSLFLILALFVVALSSELFSTYTTSLKTSAETERVLVWAEKYNSGSPEDDEQILGKIYQELREIRENESAELTEYRIPVNEQLESDVTTMINMIDKVMNILRSENGDGNSGSEENQNPAEIIVSDVDRNILYRYPNEGEITAKLLRDEEMAMISVYTVGEDVRPEDVFYYEDTEERCLKINDDKISPRIFDMIMDRDNAIKLLSFQKVEFPYWISFRVRNGEQVISFRDTITMSLVDIGYSVAFSLVSSLLAFILFVILILNLIRTHHNNKKMRQTLFRDEITGNQNWFWFAVNSIDLIKNRRKDTQYALVSLSFVRYRKFVLCHSVEAGERALKAIFQTISKNLEKKEIVAHGTTSHFPILLIANSEEEAKTKLEKILADLTKLGGTHEFKFHVGVCMIDPSVRKNADIDFYYNNASAARLTLESTDDSGIAFFDQKLVDEEKWIDKVTEHQAKAVEREEFKVYYQPKYDPRTNEQMGAEALIRWISDDMGFVSPGKFIPIFEKSGFITEIDHYMVTHVARDQKKWLDAGKKCVPVSVNISRAHFGETDLAEQIRDMVDHEGAPHELIEIELTESAFFDDQDQMLETIHKLKEYGFLVSMDDFGSGYSSLNSLKDMPLDILKLDAGFFRGKTEDVGRSRIVVSEAIRLAQKLNMTTVAEGVEDKEQVDFLAAEGCSMIQGYYYAKPMPGEEYEERIGVPAKVDEES